MQTLMCPARQSALVIGLALAAVYATGGVEAVAWFLGIVALQVAAWAWCAIGGDADAVAADQAAHAVRTRGVWS
jgi:hypothetical protein